MDTTPKHLNFVQLWTIFLINLVNNSAKVQYRKCSGLDMLIIFLFILPTIIFIGPFAGIPLRCTTLRFIKIYQHPRATCSGSTGEGLSAEWLRRPSYRIIGICPQRRSPPNRFLRGILRNSSTAGWKPDSSGVLYLLIKMELGRT